MLIIQSMKMREQRKAVKVDLELGKKMEYCYFKRPGIQYNQI